MSITTEQLKEQMKQIAELRFAETEAARVKSDALKALDLAEGKMIEMLTEAGLPNFRSEYGLASLSYRTSVKTPKTPEDKAALYEYLRSKGLYEEMISVNSATLNSFYKDELTQAKEAGNEDFQIPGLNEVTINPILSFRK